MRFYRTVYLPNASTIEDGWLSLQPSKLPGVGAQGKIDEKFGLKSGFLPSKPYRVDATAYGGRVMLSVWKANDMITHGVIVSGAEAVEDLEILRLFFDTTIESDVVKQLTAEVAEPFASILTRNERPFSATVLLPTLPRDECDALLDWHLRWAASHLAAVIA